MDRIPDHYIGPVPTWDELLPNLSAGWVPHWDLIEVTDENEDEVRDKMSCKQLGMGA